MLNSTMQLSVKKKIEKLTYFSNVVFSNNYIEFLCRCYVNLSENDVDLIDLYVDVPNKNVIANNSLL